MKLGFPNFMRQRESGTLVLRVGLTEIDFLFFEQAQGASQVLSWGSENISYFTVRQTLEKIFTQLPKAKAIRKLVATFPESQFNAQVIQHMLPPMLPRHLITKTEASSIERDALAQASRILQKSLFRESGILPNEFSLRRVKILDRRIDGYSVANLEGFNRGEIVFSVLGMFLLEPPFLPVEQFAKSHKVYDIRVMHIAEAIESFAAAHNQEGVYLCVEEEKTQIVVHKEGHIAFLDTIPMGENSFIEFFGDVLGMRESAAETFQERYFHDNLSEPVRARVEAYVLPEVKKFATLIKEKLLGAKMTLPVPVRIFGKARALRNLQSMFNDEVLQDLPFLQKPEPHFLLPAEIWKLQNFSGRDDPVYTTLYLLASAVAP